MKAADSLTGTAALAYASLREHPHLNTPGAISNGPFGIEQLSTESYLEGLRELAAMEPPLAIEKFGGWTLAM